MRTKYKTRLENVKNEMCYLNKRIIDTFNVIEEYVEFDTFIEVFGLNEDEVDSQESFYDNLIASSTRVGHVVRTGLIYNEKIVKECLTMMVR